MKIQLMLDGKQFSKKPMDGEIGGVNNRLAKTPVEITSNELEAAVIAGRSFTGGLFKDGIRSNDTWVSQQVFGLDFDHGITIEEFKAICERYGIQPTFAYTTFSHTAEHHKFRAVFIMNHVITDRRVQFMIHNALTRLFDGKADQQCKDPARLFFGGTESIYSQHDYRVDVVELIQMVCTKYTLEDKANASHHIKAFCKECYLNMNGSFPAVKHTPLDDMHESYEISASPIIYTIEVASISYKMCISFSVTEEAFAPVTSKARGGAKLNKAKDIDVTKTKWEVRRNVDLEELPQVCELARVFEEGEQYLGHAERYHLMSNYIQLEGGEARFVKGLDAHEEYDKQNRKDKARIEINYSKAAGYLPTNCAEHRCPFFNQCPNRATNILLKMGQKRGEVRRIAPISVSKSLTQAEQELETLLQAAYNGQPQVTIIKAPTGIGKTEMLTRLPLKDTMIAVPTHKLRDEVYTRLQQAGHNFLNVTERPALPEKKDEVAYMQLIQAGAYKRAMRMLFKVADKLRGSGFKTPRDRAVIDYVAMVKQMKHASNLLVTHKRLVHMEDTNVKTIIIDEDILINELLPMTQVKGQELGNLAWQAQMMDPDLHASIQAYMTQVAQAPVNQVEAMKTVLIDSKKLEDLIADHASCLTSNVAALFDCDFFVRTQDGTVHCIKKIDLTDMFPDVNIIIMSASANEKLYRQAFGQISFADIGEVQMTGKIVGHYSKGYSRHSLKEAAKFQKEMAQIKAEIGNMNVITYKGFKADVEREGLNVVATFGATAGLDQFKGQDLAVIGTPHVNNIKYVMMAKALGVKVGGFDQQQVEYTPVRRNGYEFYFNTYSKNPMLQEIQFAVIESELIQAIGRARALRFSCTVHVFSNLPIY